MHRVLPEHLDAVQELVTRPSASGCSMEFEQRCMDIHQWSRPTNTEEALVLYGHLVDTLGLH